MSESVTPKARRSLWPLAVVPGFLLLAAGEGVLGYNGWQHQADATQLAVLRTQLADLQTMQARTAPAPDSLLAQAGLAQKYTALAAQLSALQTQTAADHGALSLLQANAVDLGKLTQHMAALNALETARLALEAGLPVGHIPNAPAALAQFVSQAPPTEAGLRENFPAAAKLAEEASLSADGKLSLWARVKLRFEGLITVSDGTHVLFGPPAAGAILAAQQALDDGDLPGAVSALQALSPPVRAAMAGWLAQAQALLAARSALIALAQGA